MHIFEKEQEEPMATHSTMPKKRRFNPWLIVGAVVIVVALGAAILIVFPPRPAGAAANRISTIPVTRGSITGSVSGSGTVTADQSLDLVFQANGTVREVLVKEGDVVKKGQPLAVLDTRNLEA